MKNILLFFSLLLLAACGSSTGAPAEPTAVGPTAVQVMLATDDFEAGRPRVPFVLFSGPERVADAQKVQLTAFDLSDATAVPGWTGEATNYSDYEVPYWVAYPELPQAGNWGLVAEITLADGTVEESQLVLEVKERPVTAAIGEAVPPSQNRTLTTTPDMSQLTSDDDPEPAFYQMTVAEAIASGRPSVVVFSTPAFCQTAVCAPVLDSTEQVYDSFGDQVNFIHLEIYKEFNPALVVADEVTEWGLPSEPWTFVLDAEGKVFARLGGPVSVRELTAVLEDLLQS